MIPTEEELAFWSGVLERRFIAAGQTEAAYMEAARQARIEAISWIEGDEQANARGSFKWVCDLLGLEWVAVRKACREELAKALLKQLDAAAAATREGGA